VNDAVLATGHQLLIADPTRFYGVQVLGMDEHAWRHTRRGDKFVTVIIDLTPVRDGTGQSRLLDMVEGRSKQVFKTWLEAQTPAFRDGIEIVAMDGFTGFKTAAAEEIPDAVAVMDPFHVVALAGDALDRCRQRVQQDTCGHRGRVGDPLYGIRRVLARRSFRPGSLRPGRSSLLGGIEEFPEFRDAARRAASSCSRNWTTRASSTAIRSPCPAICSSCAAICPACASSRAACSRVSASRGSSGGSESVTARDHPRNRPRPPSRHPPAAQP
jgi:Transposase